MAGSRRWAGATAVGAACGMLFLGWPAWAEDPGDPAAIDLRVRELDARQQQFARAEALLRHGEDGQALAIYRTMLLANRQDAVAASAALAVIERAPAAERPGRLLALSQAVGPVALLSARLALYYADEGRLQDALRRMEDAAAAAPDQPVYWLDHGVLADRAGREKDAIRSYQRFFQLYQGEPVSLTVHLETIRRRLDYLRAAQYQ